jgi:hypothetical protein
MMNSKGTIIVLKGEGLKYIEYRECKDTSTYYRMSMWRTHTSRIISPWRSPHSAKAVEGDRSKYGLSKAFGIIGPKRS